MSSKMHWLHRVSLWFWWASWLFYAYCTEVYVILNKICKLFGIFSLRFNFVFRSSFKQNARCKYLFIISLNNCKLQSVSWYFETMMFYQIFLSPQVKRCTIITYKHGIYELLRILGNIRKVSKPHRMTAQCPVPLPKWKFC